MKLKVYNQEENDNTGLLRLREDYNGDLAILAVDQDGNTISKICFFAKDGQLYRCNNIDPSLGFDLDDDGHICMDDDE